MAFVETENRGPVTVIRLNRPERLNALGRQMEEELSAAWREFRDGDAEVAVLTGEGRGFCAGEDLKETAQAGVPNNPAAHDGNFFGMRDIPKPIIAAVNGHAMGGGFMMAANADLRIAVPRAVFEISEAKRWLLGGAIHGHALNLPAAVTAEMAFGFRFSAGRLHELGFLNRLVEPEQLLPTALEMADHLMTLIPAARVNTVRLLRAMRPELEPRVQRFADALREHGAQSDLVESRRAFAEKRPPVYVGWDSPGDRLNGPLLEQA